MWREICWLCQVNQNTAPHNCVCCGSCYSTLLSETLHKCVVIASLLDNANKWKKEEERAGMQLLRDYCDGDERHVDAFVTIVIMGLSGEEETLKKSNNDLEMIKLRG